MEGSANIKPVNQVSIGHHALPFFHFTQHLKGSCLYCYSLNKLLWTISSSLMIACIRLPVSVYVRVCEAWCAKEEESTLGNYEFSTKFSHSSVNLFIK